MDAEQISNPLPDYADTIVKKLLKLSEGTMLSVNTEETDFEFARIIARSASALTKTTVKIVQTINGRPSDVIEFDPEGFSAEVCGYAMLRIAHEKPHVAVTEDTLDIIVDKNDFKTIQKLGHLAQPVVLNRRISVPWACVTVYDRDDVRWEDIEKIIHSDIESAVLSTDYRKKHLHHSDIHTLAFKGDGFEFSVDLPEDVLFAGGSNSLPNGKTFVSGFDFEKLNVNVDCNSCVGTVKGNSVIFGRNQEVELEFSEGMVVRHSASDQLTRILDFDQNLRKTGYISLSDRSFSIHLGGALTECFEKEPETENDLPAFFNNCLYTLEIKLDSKLSVHATDCKGNTIELVRKGFFLE